MNTASNQDIQIDFIRLLQAIWYRIWAVILSAVILGTCFFCYAAFKITPTYRASTMLFVNNNSITLGGTGFSLDSSDMSKSQKLVTTYIVILKTRLTLESVIEEAGLDMSVTELSNMITASAVDDTQIFKVSVVSSDPSEAELIANTITKVLPEKIEDIIDGSSMRVVDYAVRPTTKVAPDITQYTLIGVVVGAVLACIVIVILELLDDGIHTSDYLTESYKEIPLLAEIPDLSGGDSSSHSYGYRYGYRSGYGKYGYGGYGYGQGYGQGNTKHAAANTNHGGKTNG